MTDERIAKDKAQVNQALEVFIQVSLAAVLVVGCLLILLPFIPLIMWGIIIAVASYPGFRKLQSALSGRGGLAAALFTLILLSLLIIPVVLLAQSLVEGIQFLAVHMRDGTLTIPPPRPSVANWPIIGAPLKSVWDMASTNLPEKWPQTRTPRRQFRSARL